MMSFCSHLYQRYETFRASIELFDVALHRVSDGRWTSLTAACPDQPQSIDGNLFAFDRRAFVNMTQVSKVGGNFEARRDPIYANLDAHSKGLSGCVRDWSWAALGSTSTFLNEISKKCYVSGLVPDLLIMLKATKANPDTKCSRRNQQDRLSCTSWRIYIPHRD